MTTMVRHGGDWHVMRPDRVMRTSVLSPMVNYSPQADVQAVAQMFTQGPPLGTDLQGLGLSFIGKIRAKLAIRRARKAMAGLAGLGMSPGPKLNMASQVAPQMQGQMAMLAHLMQRSNAMTVYGPLAAAARALEMRRPFTYYRAG